MLCGSRHPQWLPQEKKLILLGATEPEEPFRVVCNWGKEAEPLSSPTFSTDQKLDVGCPQDECDLGKAASTAKDNYGTGTQLWAVILSWSQGICVLVLEG
jgi:hypothetical protein